MTTSSSPTRRTSLFLAHGFAIIIIFIITRGFLSFTSITDTLAFYGVYHRHPINQIIHFFGVPAIICSLLVFLAHLSIPIPFVKNSAITIQIPFVKRHPFNYASIATLLYISFYLYLDLFGGVLYAPFGYLLYATANNLTVGDQEEARKGEKQKDVSGKAAQISWVGTGKLLKLAAVVHFLGWYIQIHPGHGIYEGAKPAVMQSIGGALTSAPLFAYYEGLWFIGLNKGLQDQTKALVDQYSIDLCKNGLNMRACADYDLN